MATTSSFVFVNKTEDGGYPESVSVALYALTLFLYVTLNGMVLVVLKLQKELQAYMRVLYQILAVSNTVSGLLFHVWNILWFVLGNTLNEKSCTIISMAFPYVYQISFMSVMACLCGISFNLYLLVTRPLRYYLIVTKNRFYFMLASIYLVICLVCGIYLPIPVSPFIKLLTSRCLDQNLYVQVQWASLLHTVVQICPIFVTMAFTTIIYTRLLFIARSLRSVAAPLPRNPRRFRVLSRRRDFDLGDNGRHADPPINANIDAMRDANMNHARPSKRNLKGFFTIFLLTSSFCLLWAPYVISFVTPIHPSLLPLVDKVALCSAWMQPVIYMLTNSEARRLFVTSLRRCLSKSTRNNSGV